MRIKMTIYSAVVMFAIAAIVTVSICTCKRNNFVKAMFDTNVEALARTESNLGKFCAYGEPGNQPYISCITCKQSTLHIRAITTCN